MLKRPRALTQDTTVAVNFKWGGDYKIREWDWEIDQQSFVDGAKDKAGHVLEPTG